MMKDILKAIDEIVSLLRHCEKSEEWIARFVAVRQMLEEDPKDAEAVDELYVLSAPKGFLGDFPHIPKADSGLTRQQVDEQSVRLVEMTWGAIEKWRAQPRRRGYRR